MCSINTVDEPVPHWREETVDRSIAGTAEDESGDVQCDHSCFRAHADANRAAT